MVHYLFELEVSPETVSWLADNRETLAERLAFVSQISKLGHIEAMRQVLAEPILLITAWSALVSAMAGLDAPEEVRSEARSVGEALRRTAHMDRINSHDREQLDALIDDLREADSSDEMAAVINQAVEDGRLTARVGNPLAGHLATEDPHVAIEAVEEVDESVCSFCGAIGFAVGELAGAIVACLFGAVLAPPE